MDIGNQEIISEALLNSLNSSKGLIATIFNNYQKKYMKPEKYLSDQIIKNGAITADDFTIAAELYGVSNLRRHYKNVSKIIYSADNIAKLKGISTGKIDDDWINYFLDKAKNVSDETVQNIFAYILMNKCVNKKGFKKVMLDRLALLDYDSATTFIKLCKNTYEVQASDNRHYSIPFYIRDADLYKMVACNRIAFTETDAIEYQKMRPKEDDLELLQEIGLISLSEDNDECNIYSSNQLSFTVTVNNQTLNLPSKYDTIQEIYLIVTGSCIYTVTGLELYNSLKNNYTPDPKMFNIINNYYAFKQFC